jgi:chorismate--pyruvate lyase
MENPLMMRRRSHWLLRPVGAPPALRAWLTGPGSLTRRLQAQCQRFEVCGVHQRFQRVQIDEAKLVGLLPRQCAWGRDVRLHCDGLPMIIAHSVLPEASLRGRWRNLHRIGSSSIGWTLFADPLLHRSKLRFCKLNRHDSLFQRAATLPGFNPDHLWSRRSVFRVGGARILVTEVFLSNIAKITSLP